MRYYEIEDRKKRQDWFKSLSLEDRNLIRKEVDREPNALF